MTAFANSLATNLAVTVLVLVMVFLMPWADRRICGRLGLNLQGGVSSHPKAELFLRVRKGILYGLFGLYFMAVAYIVFFSRRATRDYQVHVALFEDLTGAVQIDLGFLGFLKTLFTEGLASALSHVEIVKREDITQVYMNIMLFVPMGYFLPYLFPWFRERAWVRVRAGFTCFLIAFLIENLQLIFRRGFYDMDDLVSNTLGGILGQFLFMTAAYTVTHPRWKKEVASYRRWKRNARTKTLYPFARRMRLSRTTLLAQSEEAVWDFYIMKLGFRLVRQIVPMDTPGTDLLLEMGKLQVEIHCMNETGELPEQELTLSVRSLKPVMRRLQMNGMDPGPIGQDPYTGLRCICFQGPDHTHIHVIETGAER